MQPEQQQRIMGYFIEEAKDHLNTIEQGLLNLKDTLADPEMVNEVFRAAHSVKGGAAMLGLNSIQKTAHRLEDYFKVLKETPTIQPDQKLESLLLKVFDTLKEHLEQLQMPSGLNEDEAKEALVKLEPVFSEVEEHLTQLERKASASSDKGTVIQSESVLQDNALLLIFQNDVPAQLREMLQTFRQAETALDARDRLQEICLGLKGLGEAFGLAKWSQLIETASQAIGNSQNAYRDLAPLVITEIKQAQGLVLAGREREIAPSEALQAMAPVTSESAEMDLELADFFAIANNEGSNDFDFSGLEFAADSTDVTDDLDNVFAVSGSAIDDSSNLNLDEMFDLSEADSASVADDLNLDGMFDLSDADASVTDSLNLDEVFDLGQLDSAALSSERSGSDVGMDELNSLADLFEGETPDLGATWQQEEVIDLELASSEVGHSDRSDFANLMSEMSEGTGADELAGLFGEEESDLENAASLEAVDEFELPDFSEDVTEFGVVPAITESPAVDDLGLDELDSLDLTADSHLPVTGFEEEEGSLDNLGELFAGLDDNDLGLASLTSESVVEEAVTLDSTDLDDIFEEDPSEELNLYEFEIEAAENNVLADAPAEVLITESLLNPWDSFDLDVSSNNVLPEAESLNGQTAAVDQGFDENELEFNDLDDLGSEGLELDFSESLNGQAAAANQIVDENELGLDGFEDAGLEDLELGLDASEDAVLNSLFSEDLADRGSIEELNLELQTSEESQLDDLFGESTLNQNSSVVAEIDELDFENEDNFNFEGLSELGAEENIALEAMDGSDDVFADLLDFSSDEAEVEAESSSLNGGSVADSEDALAELLDFSSSDLDEELALADEIPPSESGDSLSNLLDFDSELDTLNVASSNEITELLDSSTDDLSIESESLNGSNADMDDAFAGLLDFSSEADTEEFSASEDDVLDLDALVGSDSSEAEDDFLGELSLNAEGSPAVEASHIDLDLEFDEELATDSPVMELESSSDFDLGFGEQLSTDPQDDFADLNLDLFGAEAQGQEAVEAVEEGLTDDLGLGDLGSDDADGLGDLDALLNEEESSADDGLDALLGAGIGTAAIATGLGVGIAAMSSKSEMPSNEMDELDSLLGSDDELDALLGEEASGLDDLDLLLDEPAPNGVSGGEGFDDLESLLAEAPEAITSQTSFAATNEADAEFGDLEKMLEEADQAMGGSPANRAAATPGRRSPRAAKGFSEQTMRVPVKHLDNLSNLVGELVVNRNSLEQDQERLRQSLDNLLYQVQQLSDVGQRMQDLYERSLLESSLLASRQNHRVPFGGSERSNGNSTGVEYDPLEMDRFTGFHSLSQEMIELIVRVRESSSDIEFIVDEADQVTRMFRQVTTQLQEGLTRSRMVPFAQTADRLPRAVRDIAMKCGKQAELVIEGRDTLIDKMILEHLYDPMTHLVNNAITHGIEDPEVRRASGKSPTGRITIRAFHQGNQTVISVSDDGAGVDVERVRSKATEKGLITAAEARNASRLDIYDLLFHPGFSTKDQADDFSGRGVGMDVVRTSLSEIRGAISTDSGQGKGTTFTIRLPLTLSISKALCCISDRARIAFPMDGVEDMLDLPKERLQTDAEGNPCISWRDTLLPVRPLKDLLGYNRHLSRGNVYGGNQEDDMVSIVILRSAGNYLALQVDQVLGEQEIVIKQLEGPVPKPIGVAGATVLGDGRIMPIADVLELIDLSVGRIRRDAGSMWEQGTGQPVVEAVAKTEPMVLIVDDSITVRELLSMTFNKVGYRVEQARDGQEAWEKLRSGLPCDIVFCDIEMPRMDGLELLSRIQKDPNLANLPIAMLTSRGADRHRQMAASLGASGYFTKPYLEEALLDAAQRMLKGEILISSNNPGNS
ncbi:MAG: response regulator [Leptolyngbya sp. Prado105]|jgi:chemosensory pili system protein ChpA (sensor histidine kinase/response regulator)|nr:response regulator [Leptolyngbya sp. Prado105]